VEPAAFRAACFYLVSGRVKKISECLARQSQRRISLDARRICPVGIRVVMVEVIDHCVGYAPRDLSATWTVEISDGIPP
jgi:hypothetical protein